MAQVGSVGSQGEGKWEQREEAASPNRKDTAGPWLHVVKEDNLQRQRWASDSCSFQGHLGFLVSVSPAHLSLPASCFLIPEIKVNNPKEKAPKPMGIFILSRLTSVGKRKKKIYQVLNGEAMTFARPGHCVKRKIPQDCVCPRNQTVYGP